LWLKRLFAAFKENTLPNGGLYLVYKHKRDDCASDEECDLEINYILNKVVE